MVHQEYQDFRDIAAQVGHLEPAVFLARADLQGSQDTLVIRGTVVLQVSVDIAEIVDRQAQVESVVHLEYRDRQDSQDIAEHRALREHQEPLV